MTQLPAASDLPDRLLDHAQWICWRTQEREDRTTKVPINPATGRFASTTDADTWGDFEAARTYATDGPVDGLGFVFTGSDPFVGIDLDDCRDPDTGSLTDDAHDIVEEVESYTEVSPSGTGVHVLAAGPAPEGRNRHDKVECYATARFFTMTGNHLSETPTAIHDRPDALETVYADHLQPEATDESYQDGDAAETAARPTDGQTMADTVSTATEATTGAAGGSGNRLSDAEVLAKAKQAANGDKFRRLWHGSTSRYPSHSEADMALCGLLAFWTGNDSQQIDRLFRRSGLMRPKWDEEHFAEGSTYGEKTIERVVAATDEVYKSPSAPTGATATDQSPEQPTTDSDAPTATATSAADSGGREPPATTTERSEKASAARARATREPSTEAPAASEPATEEPTTGKPRHEPPGRLRRQVRKLQAEVDWLERRRRLLRAQLEAVTDEAETDGEADSDAQDDIEDESKAGADAAAKAETEDTTGGTDGGGLGSLLPW